MTTAKGLAVEGWIAVGLGIRMASGACLSVSMVISGSSGVADLGSGRGIGGITGLRCMIICV